MEMSELDIVKSYVESKRPVKQIRILAELNQTTSKEIKAILDKHKAEPIKIKPKKIYKTRLEYDIENAKIVDMVSKGFKQDAIMRELKLNIGVVRGRIFQLRKKGIIPPAEGRHTNLYGRIGSKPFG